MQTISQNPVDGNEVKNNARPATTTEAGTGTFSGAVRGDKPFRLPQTRSIKGLPLLWPISDAMLWGSEQDKGSVQHSPIRPMSEEDRKFFLSALKQLREITKHDLEFLARYDEGLSHQDAQMLCDAIRIIDRVVIVA